MHAMVISETDARKGLLGTDARNQKSHFDGCTQRTFGQWMRERYGANPGCTQATCQIYATPLPAEPRTSTMKVPTCCTHWVAYATKMLEP